MNFGFSAPNQIDHWEKSTKVTIDFSLQMPPGGFTPNSPLFGMGTAISQPNPWVISMGNSPGTVQVSFKTSDEYPEANLDLSHPSDHRSSFSLGTAKQMYRISIQIDLDTASVSAYVDGSQVAITALANMSAGDPFPLTGAQHFIRNDHWPFMIGAEGIRGPMGHPSGGTDVQINALHVLNSLRYSGSTQAPLTDRVRYFDPNPNTVFLLNMQGDPRLSTEIGGRIVTAYTMGSYIGAIGYFLNTSNGGPLKHNAIRGLNLQTGPYGAPSVAVGAVTDFTIDKMLINGYQGVASHPHTYPSSSVQITNTTFYTLDVGLLRRLADYHRRGDLYSRGHRGSRTGKLGLVERCFSQPQRILCRVSVFRRRLRRPALSSKLDRRLGGGKLRHDVRGVLLRKSSQSPHVAGTGQHLRRRDGIGPFRHAGRRGQPGEWIWPRRVLHAQLVAQLASTQPHRRYRWSRLARIALLPGTNSKAYSNSGRWGNSSLSVFYNSTDYAGMPAFPPDDFASVIPSMPLPVSVSEVTANIVDFGASPDADPATNAIAIQKAVDSLIAGQNGSISARTVYVPATTKPFLIDRSIWMDSSFLELRGEGQGSQIAMAPGAKHPMIIMGSRRSVPVAAYDGSGHYIGTQQKTIDASFRRDLFGVLDASAAPAANMRWGLKTNNLGYVEIHSSPMNLGPFANGLYPDYWVDTS